MPETLWEHVWDRDGQPRDLDDAGVIELTGLLRTSHRETNCRTGRPTCGSSAAANARRRAHSFALEEADGWRYQLFATNTGRGQLEFLEARHRARARVEDRCGKNTGLGHLPHITADQRGLVCRSGHRRGPAVLALGPRTRSRVPGRVTLTAPT